MRKILFIIVCVMFILTGCATNKTIKSGAEANTSEEATPEATTPEATTEEELSMMQKVLLDEEGFIYVDSADGFKAGLKIKNLPTVCNAYDNYESYDRTFYSVDLDRDGNDEIIADLGIRGTYIIFYDAGDMIYGYEMHKRAMTKIYSDGTFDVEGGASVSYHEKIKKFTVNGIERELIVKRVWENLENRKYIVHYYLDDDEKVEISEEEYNELMKQHSREEVKKQNLTRDNIEKLSDNK